MIHDNLQLPCVQPPTSLCMYNLHLPCVQPPTSLCTTTNFLIKPSNCSAFWTLLGTLGSLGSEWVPKITKSAQSAQKCPECRAIWWFYEEVGCCTQGRWRLYTRKVEVVHTQRSWSLYTRKLEVEHKEVGGCHESWMNEEVMCGHPAEVLWTSCRGYVVRKVGIELLWQLKRLQNSLRHVVMA